MRRPGWRFAGLAAFVVLTSAAARAQIASDSPPSLSLSGHIARPHAFSLGELAAMPKVTLDQPATGKPAEAGATHVTGVLLWPMLDQAGWVDQPGRKTHLQHVVLARGRDGYTVALSIAEIDPGLEGKQVLVAITAGGKAPGRLDLFVPGDKRAGRHVHDLVAIDVE